MILDKLWKKYPEADFNLSTLPEEIVKQGKVISFPKGRIIASRGEFPRYLYFIRAGRTVGSRAYADGNEYNYFQLDQSNGNIGLLEILARKDEYIATVMCITDVEVLRIDADVIYEFIMEDQQMLQRCITFVARDLYMRSGNDGILYYLDGLGRLRHYLINYYELHQNDNDEQDRVIVMDEYQDIARQIGVSIRTVGRSIRKLKDNKDILSERKKIVLTKDKHEILFEKLWS